MLANAENRSRPAAKSSRSRYHCTARCDVWPSPSDFPACSMLAASTMSCMAAENDLEPTYITKTKTCRKLKQVFLRVPGYHSPVTPCQGACQPQCWPSAATSMHTPRSSACARPLRLNRLHAQCMSNPRSRLGVRSRERVEDAAHTLCATITFPLCSCAQAREDKSEPWLMTRRRL